MLFMAIHAHSTRTPLLPQSGNPQPLLGQGLVRQLGPVTQAIRTMRAADRCTPAVQHADQAIADIQIGLASFFADADRQRVRELRRRIADRIEADIALLDALAGDADLEAENEHGGDVQDEPHDPEEDMGAEEDEGSAGLVTFDGINYRRVRA
jgi:hypothetical protein